MAPKPYQELHLHEVSELHNLVLPSPFYRGDKELREGNGPAGPAPYRQRGPEPYHHPDMPVRVQPQGRTSHSPPTRPSGDTPQPAELPPLPAAPPPRLNSGWYSPFLLSRDWGRRDSVARGTASSEAGGLWTGNSSLTFGVVNCGDRKDLLVLGGQGAALRASGACL